MSISLVIFTKSRSKIFSILFFKFNFLNYLWLYQMGKKVKILKQVKNTKNKLSKSFLLSKKFTIFRYIK